jgi:DNA-binding IclR family transcriptional regulator
MTNLSKLTPTQIEGDTPAMRLFSLLEVIAAEDSFFSLQALVDKTGLPKPTLHRMLSQLESAGIVQRDGDSRHYSAGLRFRALASQLMMNNTLHGARHIILSQLVRQVGESCNITTFSGGEVVYVDRMETDVPLRFTLQPGSRVPVHCSATGKLFLAQMAPAQRKRLLENWPLERLTEKTLTDVDSLNKELEAVKRDGYAMDREEFLPGLLCIAVLVPNENGRSGMGVAIQAPSIRLNEEKAIELLPALRDAAKALAKVNDDGLSSAAA